ncbi:MAG: repair protein RadC [Crocinitomicaceae bacterium]|jgi:DNA repair protein RadC|nr:repair protein RadC [Crocinitomicaceae bacterium]
MNVRLTKDQKIKIINTDDIYNIMQQILLRENKIRRGQEHFWIVGLSKVNKILFIELIALGADNMVKVKAIDIFRMCVYKLAHKVIFVHNHPSGSLKPSNEDIDYTNFLMKSGELLGLEVIDHLIIAEKSYTSFDQQGIIEKLRKSTAYKIVDRFEAAFEEVKIKSAEKKGKKDLAIDIAKKMLDKGDSLDLIREYTGLTEKEISKIK